jgi:hypothetical protein
MKTHQWKLADMRRHISTLKDFEGTTVAAAKAMSDIQERELYKEHYSTIKEFCENELGWTKQRLYQIINFHKLKESLSKIKTDKVNTVLTFEGRASRALQRVPEAQRAEVLEEATKDGGKATTDSINKAIATVFKADVIEVDKEGHAIPTPAVSTWKRRDEVDEYLVWISRIKSWAEKLQKSSDTFYAVKEFSAQEVFTDCGNLYRMIKNLVPHSICSVCQGQAPKSCALCHGKGMISKHTWEHGVAKETKAMMKKKAEDDSPQRLSAAGG